MQFDFSAITRSGSATDVDAAFQGHVRRRARLFAKKYGVKVPDAEATEMVKEAVSLVELKGGKVFVIVDEYDRFAQLMFERPLQCATMTQPEEDATTAPLRAFFETLKATGVRSFTTGVMPIALADSSGWNCCEDLTHDPDFATVCGLRGQDVLSAVYQIVEDSRDRDKVFALMRRTYSGYRFYAEDGASEALFNTQMCLFFFDRWLLPEDDVFRADVLGPWSQVPETADVNELLDPNQRLTGKAVMRIVAKHPHLPLLQTGLASTRGSAVANVGEVFRLRDLLDEDAPGGVDRLSSFMFNHGLVTLAESVRAPQCLDLMMPDEITMPNRVVDDPLFGLLPRMSAMLDYWKPDVEDTITRPTPAKVWRLVSHITRGLSTKYDRSFTEVGLQALLEYALRRRSRTSHGFTVTCETEYHDGTPRANVRLQAGASVLVLELKRLRPEGQTSRRLRTADVLGATEGELKRPRTYLNDQRTARGKRLDRPQTVRVSPIDAVACCTVEQLRDNALRQATCYENRERSGGTKVAMCAVVHWTPTLQSGCQGESFVVVSSVMHARKRRRLQPKK